MNAMAKPLSDRDITNIAAYLQPPGYVAVATSSTPGLAAATTSGAAVTAPTAEISPRSGDAVYRASCVACHAAGVAGAPKLADKSASKPRIAQGLPTLQKHALQGLNAMPIASRDAINRSARLKTDPRWLANKRTIADLGPPQFATVQRRIHARGEHPPRRPMACLRQGNGNIRIGPERQRLPLPAVPVLVVPVPRTLGPDEQEQTSAVENLPRISNLPVDARTFTRPFQTGL